MGHETDGIRAVTAAANTARAVLLENRGILAVTGPESRTFLQGLISNDIDKVSPERAIYAAFLTAQGRYLHDFFIAEHDGALLIDCEADRRDDLFKRLRLFKLRAKAEIEDRTGTLAVAALIGPEVLKTAGLSPEPGAARGWLDGVVYTDPRTPEIGARAILPAGDNAARLSAEGFTPAGPEDYEAARLSLGLPDGSRDMPVEDALLMESNFDRINGLDWEKGCYVGQEITARMNYRGLVKKRLYPVTVSGSLPAPGTEVTSAGKKVGEIRSGAGERALALLKVEAVEAGGALVAGEATVVPDA